MRVLFTLAITALLALCSIGCDSDKSGDGTAEVMTAMRDAPDMGGEAAYTFIEEGLEFVIDVTNDAGPLSPDDAVLLSVGNEWLRLVTAGDEWRKFEVDSFTVTITAPVKVDVSVAKAAAQTFIKKIQGTTVTPVTPHEEWRVLAPSHLERYAELSSEAKATSVSQILAVFPKEAREGFYAIGCAESGFKADAVGKPNTDGSIDYGIFQINSRYFDGTWASFPEEAKTDALANARSALIIYEDRLRYDGHGFEPWSTWNAGGKTAAGTLALAKKEGQCL